MDAAAPIQSTEFLDLTSSGVVKWCRRIVIGMVVVGACCRIYQYALAPCYWNDEAAIVSNVLHRGYSQLIKPLDYAQVAPPLFLWCERALAETFGASEYSLRSLPLLLGLMALGMFALLAWRLLPPTSAAWAVGWFAMSDRVITPHVCEVKQYSGDMCLAILLLLVSLGRKPGVSAGRRLAAAACAGAIGVWFSFPVAFVFAAISLALAGDLLRQGRRGVCIFVGWNALFAASFGGLAMVSLSQPHDAYLDAFWQEHFVPLKPWYAALEWLPWSVRKLCNYPFAGNVWPLVLILVVAGGVALWRTGGRKLMVFFLLMLGLNLVAAALRLYPFAGNRLSLYGVPAMLLVMAAGAEPLLLPLKWKWLVRWWFVLAGPLLILTMGQTIRHVVRPEQSSFIRGVARYMREHRREDEPIYLVADGCPHERVTGTYVDFLCYWPDAPGSVRFHLPAGVGGKESLPTRFWVVYSLSRGDKGETRKTIVAEMEKMGAAERKGQGIEIEGAGAILFGSSPESGESPANHADTESAATKTRHH